jgi:hypothetical protein
MVLTLCLPPLISGIFFVIHGWQTGRGEIKKGAW